MDILAPYMQMNEEYKFGDTKKKKKKLKCQKLLLFNKAGDDGWPADGRDAKEYDRYTGKKHQSKRSTGQLLEDSGDGREKKLTW